MTWAELIRVRMARAGYGSTALAMALGVRRPTVVRWRAGSREPEEDQWGPLVAALDIQKDELEAVVGVTKAMAWRKKEVHGE